MESESGPPQGAVAAAMAKLPLAGLPAPRKGIAGMLPAPRRGISVKQPGGGHRPGT